MKILEIIQPSLIGITIIIFRKPYARLIVNFENAAWGYKYGKKELEASQKVATAVGIVLIVFSALTLAGIVG